MTDPTASPAPTTPDATTVSASLVFDAAEYPVVLFDLDGTIADSRPGIEATMRATLDRFGMPQPDSAELTSWIGPPVTETFHDRVGMRGEQLTEAMAFYVEQYDSVGWRDATLYDGIADLIADLAASGRTVGVATSKREKVARLMLATFGLSEHFAFVGGAAEDDSRGTKALVIEHTLVNLGMAPEGDRQVGGVVMIGDRIHDIDGANEFGIPTLLAGWGYGGSLEHKSANAIAHNAAEARTRLGL